MAINLNREMKSLLDKEYTHVIVRHYTNVKCNCWREESNTPDPQCLRCKGEGWLFLEFMEKGQSYFISMGGRVAHYQDFEYGLSYSNAMTLYLPSNMKTQLIKLDDHIFEVADAKSKPVVRTRKWVVTDVFPMRIESDKSQFLKILAKPVVV